MRTIYSGTESMTLAVDGAIGRAGAPASGQWTITGAVERNFVGFHVYNSCGSFDLLAPSAE